MTHKEIAELIAQHLIDNKLQFEPLAMRWDVKIPSRLAELYKDEGKFQDDVKTLEISVTWIVK